MAALLESSGVDTRRGGAIAGRLGSAFCDKIMIRCLKINVAELKALNFLIKFIENTERPGV